MLYTDGVTESEDPERQLYGDENFVAVLDGIRDGDAGATIDAVVADVSRHAAGQPAADDLTLLAVRLCLPS